jgi:hypothetical protein
VQYFNDDQLTDLAERLIALTEAGAMAWQSSKQDPHYRFFSRSPEFTFIVASRDLDDLAPHILRVLDRTKSPVRLLQEVDTQFTPPEVAAPIADLYDLVKRKTLELDETAERVFKSLDDLQRNIEG